ncbi:MAG TPA: choline dehydrogenase [Rubricoccaceae bacterium]|jgi:choline dehydrogenase
MDSFDFVIVGAGSSGCVLANRLTEDPAVTVLLLEAGAPDTRPEIHIPAAFSKLFQTEADWNYHTAPQPHLGGRRLYWPRGKTLGGSSSINAMIYVRGHWSDYDEWAALGCTGWGYADVLPYFKKSEDSGRGRSAYHGTGGPLRVEAPRDASPVMRAFIEAAGQAGYPATDDFNGPDQEGAGLYDLTQKGGRRQSAAAAFLRPARRRPNLTVWTHAHARRVVFEGGRAVGVELDRDGQTVIATANCEVVLCGGAVNTPQTLMLSGVGPAAHLREMGIEVVADRPAVGENLQDHLITGLRVRLRGGGSLLDAENVLSVLRYVAFRRGMLASNVAEAGLFVHTRPGERAPDVQFHVAPALFENHGLTRSTEHGYSIGPTLVRPRSRGHVRLASADPYDHPTIDPNYLADEADGASLVAGLKVAREISRQPALDATRGGEISPGVLVRSDADLLAYVRENSETLYHPVGTCRMGADAGSVVDPDLRVRGVRGLRVVDASVMPVVPNGNTNAAALMIAEKAADLIRYGAPAPGGDGAAVAVGVRA